MQEVESFLDKVARARGGDVQAMNEILVHTRDQVMVLFRRDRQVDPDRCQDLAQEFMIRLWRAVPRLRTALGFWKTAWAIARCVVVDEHRRRREPEFVPPEDLVDVPSAESAAWPVEEDSTDAPMVRALRSAVDSLPRADRSLVLGQLAGLDHETLARRRRISRACIKTRLYRQRQRIRRLLDARICAE